MSSMTKRSFSSGSRGFTEPAKIEGFSKTSFYTMLIFTIIVSVVIIVVLYLYFRRDASRIDPAECPEAVSGLVLTPDKRVEQVASNCGSNLNCTYTVGSVAEARDICLNLGTEKCVSFSLTQQPLSSDYTMVVSEGTETVDVTGTDTLRVLL